MSPRVVSGFIAFARSDRGRCCAVCAAPVTAEPQITHHVQPVTAAAECSGSFRLPCPAPHHRVLAAAQADLRRRRTRRSASTTWTTTATSTSCWPTWTPPSSILWNGGGLTFTRQELAADNRARGQHRRLRRRRVAGPDPLPPRQPAEPVAQRSRRRDAHLLAHRGIRSLARAECDRPGGRGPRRRPGPGGGELRRRNRRVLRRLRDRRRRRLLRERRWQAATVRDWCGTRMHWRCC